MRTPLFLLLLCIIAVGCEKEPKVWSVKVKAQFTLGSETYVMEQDIPTNGIGNVSGNIGGSASFSSTSNVKNEALFLGTHLADSTHKFINAGPDALDRATRPFGVLWHYDNFFVTADNIVTGADLECWTCFTYFSGHGYSLTFMTHMDDATKKEVWSTAYGDQSGSSLTVNNLGSLQFANDATGAEVYNVMGDIVFSCTLYNKLGESRPISGTATMFLLTTR